jgi:hypothetical protein
MKRWQKVLVFFVGMSFFALICFGIGQAASAWDSVTHGICGAACPQASQTGGAIFWIQIVGLVLMSVCGIMWIVLPDHDLR